MWPRAMGAWLALFAAFVAGAATPPPLPAEHLEVARLPPPSPHWIWAFDYSNNNETDMRLYLYDGDTHRQLGQVDAGYYPGFTVSPDGRTTTVATTYFSRGSHGARTDVVEFTDNATLSFSGEIVIPKTRAHAPPSHHNVSYSADAHLLYVFNLTPAASFTVIDLAKRAVVGEVDTDGCVLVIPSAQRRVSSLCESGRLLSVTLDDSGHEVSRNSSQPFFSVDQDPIFVQGAPSSNGVVFLSFLGDVYAVDLSGTEPKFAPAWPTTGAAERGKWRPGGNQVVAVHRASSRLFVPMHRGGSGSHKIGGSEIWVSDALTHRRIARWPVDEKKYGGAVGLAVSQDDKPLLFVVTENSALLTFDATTGHLLHAEPKVGQSLWYLINP